MLFKDYADLMFKLESVSKRYDKTKLIAEVFKNLDDEDVKILPLALQGNFFPRYITLDIGVSSKLVLKAISKTYNSSVEKIEKLWKEKGDLGLVAQSLSKKEKQMSLFSKSLTLKEVFNALQKFPEITGEKSVDKKLTIIIGFLSRAKDLEVKYLVRLLIGDLRAGIGEGILRDSLILSFIIKEWEHRETDELLIPKDLSEKVQLAFDILNDESEIALILKYHPEDFEKFIKIKIFRPIKLMLAQRVKNVQESFSTVGKPAMFEYKYDGFRVQIHKNNDEIKLFTRKLEDVTKQFPDVLPYLKKNIKAKKIILDSEFIGYDPETKKALPFQKISQRIKRKYDIIKLSELLPVKPKIFDIILLEDKELLNTHFKERRKLLEENVIVEENKIELSNALLTDNLEEAQQFYNKSLEEGNEGLMAKNLEGIYKPGSRVGYMVKIKPILDTLDLVILGGEYGEGKRSNWISSFIVGVRSGDEFLTIGKVGSGLKEKEEEGLTFKQLTEMLKPLIIEEKGKEVKVKPKIVVEVAMEEIQKSESYSSGFALRFPRIIKLRDDKSIDETTTLEEIKTIYKLQRHRNE